ncbi:MAG: hypothetical protein ACKO96_02755 [Flammeovirgaceae bacterium]
MKYIILTLLVATAWSCKEEEVSKAQKSCSTLAMVRDLRGLDGCGFVFELPDGKKLEPLRVWYCGTPPISKEQMEDPLANFEFVDGKQVKIGYDLVEGQASICMVGTLVKITCLEEMAVESKD